MPSLLDPKSAQAYADFEYKDTYDIVQEVDGPPAQVCLDWIDKIFIASNKIVVDGVGRGKVGLKRYLAAVDAYETILAVGLPDAADAGADQVPSILFEMNPFGVIPWTAFLSLVKFEPVDGGKRTTVRWGLKSLPVKNADGSYADDLQIRVNTEAMLKGQMEAFAALYKKN
ncbi:hypothetical protein DFJ73DRAFT_833267 [Zopfochytrium polystomum]|nr:hypothetical protein DFJ73DRAFT_833267 [Zopfochytrium polystomum]